ncbi:hypothetical protein GCM10010336_30980 [Streptomyces goshikiensis]|nr:hypothetical protein GCM10010336_30980 [Streptomyces goshikiensis]
MAVRADMADSPKESTRACGGRRRAAGAAKRKREREGAAERPGGAGCRSRPVFSFFPRAAAMCSSSPTGDLGTIRSLSPNGNSEGAGRMCAPPLHLTAGSSYRNELISIVSVRPGPTPIAEIGAPDISSRAFT